MNTLILNDGSKLEYTLGGAVSMIGDMYRALVALCSKTMRVDTMAQTNSANSTPRLLKAN